MKFIPVNSPLFQGNEKKYLQQCIDSNWVSSDGYFVQKFEEEFAKWSGNKYAIAVCNGTTALETAIWATIKNVINKEIALPASTIISCVLPILRLQGIPKFLDLADDKKNLSIPFWNKAGINAIAQMPVHLFGHYNIIATNLPLIEDASQYWKPFKVKDVACYSLYANKLITSGEGGVVVTNKKAIWQRTRLYRNLAHSKERFIHTDIAYNFRMSNLQAAVALAQLEQIDKFTKIKQKNRDLYKKYLSDKVQILFDVEVPWMYLIETDFDAGIMIKKLKNKGIDCRRFFYPLHRQPCFKGKYEHLEFPNSDYAWKHWFYLPSGLTLPEKQIKYICRSLQTILN